MFQMERLSTTPQHVLRRTKHHSTSRREQTLGLCICDGICCRHDHIDGHDDDKVTDLRVQRQGRNHRAQLRRQCANGQEEEELGDSTKQANQEVAKEQGDTGKAKNKGKEKYYKSVVHFLYFSPLLSA